MYRAVQEEFGTFLAEVEAPTGSTLPQFVKGEFGAYLECGILDIDIERCPNCGAALKIIAAIEEPGVIARILTHLGLSARAQPRAGARLAQRIPAA